MRTDCTYCGPQALALAAQYKMSPSQVIPGRKTKGGKVVVRCLCCGRIWESKAAWTKKVKIYD